MLKAPTKQFAHLTLIESDKQQVFLKITREKTRKIGQVLEKLAKNEFLAKKYFRELGPLIRLKIFRAAKF